MHEPNDGALDGEMLFRFFNEIGIVEQLSRNRLERVLPCDLTMSQFIVLNHFVRLGDRRSPHELARAMQVSKPTMTNTVQKLEAKGLVSVIQDPQDGRGKIVAITPAGRSARDQAIRNITPELLALASDLGPGLFETVLPHLEILRRKLDADRSP